MDVRYEEVAKWLSMWEEPFELVYTLYNDKYLELQVHDALYSLKSSYNQMPGFHAMTFYLVPTIGIILGRNSVLIG